MLRLARAWVWDFWFADHGGLFHIYYLQAPRSLPDGTWCMFYTGTGVVEGGYVQRIGLATSADRYRWRKHPASPVLAADPRWYERSGNGVLDETWRDPWVFADPGGDGWHLLLTARASQGPGGDRGGDRARSIRRPGAMGGLPAAERRRSRLLAPRGAGPLSNRTSALSGNTALLFDRMCVLIALWVRSLRWRRRGEALAWLPRDRRRDRARTSTGAAGGAYGTMPAGVALTAEAVDVRR